jgi:2-(1,2-epoxy-1,2-dihydrophenyl)acetyl-CoA isomerase
VSSISTSTERNTAENMLAMLKDSAETILLLRTMPKPTIAMIRGAVAGGGLGFALGCDLRYGDETTRMTYAYTKIALSGDFAVNLAS